MIIAEKIYFTWLILASPVCLLAWLFDINEYNQPKLMSIMSTFVITPVVIGFVSIFIFMIVQIWK